MAKKRTIEDMQAIAKKRGGRCLSKKYVNNKTKLEWQCEKGHVWKATPDSISRISWCPVCSKAEAGKRRRQTIEEMQELAKSKGFECLSSEYKSAKENLKWRCAKGHVWLATPDRAKNKDQWCKICAKEERKLKAMIKRKCEQCGNTFYVRPYVVRVGEGRYCSTSCHRKAQRKHYKKPLDSKRIVHLYVEERMPCTKIAKMYGCHYDSIYEVLRKEGVQRRDISDAKKGIVAKNPRYHTELSVETVVKDYEAGLSTKDIARKYKCSPPAIRYRLKKAGVVLRSSKEGYLLFLKSDRFPEWAESRRKQIIRQYESGDFPRQIRTGIEMKVRDELERRGYKEGKDFIHQLKFHDKFLCDFVFLEQKLIVECDGDFWHANPAKYAGKKLKPAQKKGIARDKSKNAYIRKVDNGTWKLLRFWGSDIRKDVKACVDKIEKALKKS